MVTTDVHSLRNMVNDFIPIVNNAYKNLLASNDFYEYIPEIKNNNIAKIWQDKADAELHNGDYLLALEYQTRAVAFAENAGDMLGKYFTHRAILLSVMNYWQKVYEDIQRALNCTKDVTNVSFLECFRQSSIQIMTDKDETELVKRLPRIAHHEINELFPCSTTSIIIDDDETEGQRVIATSRLHISETLVVEKPLFIAPYKNESILFCHECMLFCVNPIPCSNCSNVAFCGEVCRDSAWQEYHKYECYLQSVVERNQQHRLALKIALAFHDYIDTPFYCPEKYINVLKSEISLDNVSDETKDDFALFAAQVFHGLRENTTFFKDITNPRKFNIFKGLLMRLMLIVDEYKQEWVRTYKYLCFGSQKTFSVSCTGLYPFAKHFRIGCAPNASVSFYETSLVIKALRVIKPGEELLIDGECHYTTTSRRDRQAFYQRKYSTTCKCPACENDWPLAEDLESNCEPNVGLYLAFFHRILDTMLPDLLYVIHLHALVKDDIGVYLVGPSVEWLSCQAFLDKAHQYFCTSCDSLSDFLRRALACGVP